MIFFECGCCIRDDGKRTRCPQHDWELEKFYASQETPYPTSDYPTSEEIQAEIAHDDMPDNRDDFYNERAEERWPR